MRIFTEKLKEAASVRVAMISIEIVSERVKKKSPCESIFIKHVTTILLLIKYPTIDVHSIYCGTSIINLIFAIRLSLLQY